MKGSKKYFVVIIVMILMAMIYGYYLYNKPVPSIADRSADFSMSPSELIYAFEKNEPEANQNYLDKIIQIEGDVDKIEAPRTVYISTGSPLSSIIIEFEDSLSISSIQEGDQITVKGVCTGYLMDVVLNRAVLIDK